MQVRSDNRRNPSEEDHSDRRSDWAAGERVAHRTLGWVGTVAVDPKTGRVMDAYDVTWQHGRFRRVDVYVRWDHTDTPGYFDAAALHKRPQRHTPARPGPR